MAHTDDLIADYLAELGRVVPASPSRVRAMLTDSEAHLRDAVDRHLAEGLEPWR